MGQDLILILVFVLAVILAIFVAAAEAALLRTSPARAQALSAEPGRPAERLAALVANLRRVLSTILLTALLAQITAATLAGILAERRFGSIGVTIASIVLTLGLFIYGEAIPKTIAVQNSDRVALALSGPITVLERVLRPIVAALVWFADLQAPGDGITVEPSVTERELRILAVTAAEEGSIEQDDLELIERAFRFGDRRSDDIMVPRTEITGVAADTSVAEATEVALSTGHRRLPVFADNLDHITGVVRLRDLAAVPADRRDLPVGHLATTPLVVPESKRIVELLRDMQSSGTHLAIVVDEYGGTAGLATVEDVVEELLGSISADGVDEEIAEVGPGRWTASGLLPVEDLEALLETALPDGDWNTAAGLVIGQLGRLPRIGDTVTVGEYTLRVQSVRGRRINRIEIASVSSSD